ncbi:MAG: hypothetical protein Gaeavirus15_14, partial [Gaeavirus sp.]
MPTNENKADAIEFLIPDELYTLTKLHELRIVRDNLTIAPQIKNLTNLKYLCLVSNLEDFPIEICELTALNTLELSNNKFIDIPSQ